MLACLALNDAGCHLWRSSFLRDGNCARHLRVSATINYCCYWRHFSLDWYTIFLFPTHPPRGGSLPLQETKAAEPSVLGFSFPGTPCNSDLPFFPAICTVANVNQPGPLRCLGISGHRLMAIGQSRPTVAVERRLVDLYLLFLSFWKLKLNSQNKKAQNVKTLPCIFLLHIPLRH